MNESTCLCSATASATNFAAAAISAVSDSALLCVRCRGAWAITVRVDPPPEPFAPPKQLAPSECQWAGMVPDQDARCASDRPGPSAPRVSFATTGAVGAGSIDVLAAESGEATCTKTTMRRRSRSQGLVDQVTWILSRIKQDSWTLKASGEIVRSTGMADRYTWWPRQVTHAPASFLPLATRRLPFLATAHSEPSYAAAS
jgi:hypothetical protein